MLVTVGVMQLHLQSALQGHHQEEDATCLLCLMLPSAGRDARGLSHPGGLCLAVRRHQQPTVAPAAGAGPAAAGAGGRARVCGLQRGED